MQSLWLLLLAVHPVHPHPRYKTHMFFKIVVSRVVRLPKTLLKGVATKVIITKGSSMQFSIFSPSFNSVPSFLPMRAFGAVVALFALAGDRSSENSNNSNSITPGDSTMGKPRIEVQY